MTKFVALWFGDATPQERGSESFAANLPRKHLEDKDFAGILSESTEIDAYTFEEVESERVEACRQWYLGWDDAEKAVRPALDTYAALECPLCGASRRPVSVNKDESVTYTCPPDHKHHGSQYTWRIAVDGTLVE